MRKKVYISGKIGEEVLSDATREKFAKAEALLKSKGYDVFNPTNSGFGKIADDPLLDIGDMQALHRVFDLLLTVGARHAFESCRKVQIVTHTHIRIDRRNLRQIADAPLDLQRFLGDVIAVYQHGT